jgi:hypothetical protein
VFGLIAMLVDVEEPESQSMADLLDNLLVRRDARASVELELDHPCSI